MHTTKLLRARCRTATRSVAMGQLMVYTQSASFKSGWVAGFYDALSDDGLRYLDEILRHGLKSDEQRDFLAGYCAGQRVRRGPTGTLQYHFAVLPLAA